LPPDYVHDSSVETRTELIKPGNNGIQETVEKADDLFDREGILHVFYGMLTFSAKSYRGESRFKIVGHYIRPCQTQSPEHEPRGRGVQCR